MSRGPLHKAAIRGEYRMVKIRVECGEDVDQKDQVLVFSSLCNFCAKPWARLLAFPGLGILTFFSCLRRLQAGPCVGVLRQLSSWQGKWRKNLYKTLIAYLAFVNEFIPHWPVMTDTIIKTDNITGKFANFSVFFFPVLGNCFRILGFTYIYYVSRKWTRKRHIIAHDVVNGFDW